MTPPATPAAPATPDAPGARAGFTALSEGAGPRVFAFAQAGAGCAQLVPLANRCLPAIAVWGATLPGRQSLLHEPNLRNLDQVVAQLAEAAGTAVAQRPGEPYALFGYCGGALQAFLVARVLRQMGLPAPTGLVVVSFEAPDVARLPRGVAHLPADRLWAELAASGGVPPALVETGAIRQLTEPAVRADFAMIANYRHRPDVPLDMPIVVCHGARDQVHRGAWLGWRRQTTAGIELRELPGSHWLLDDCLDDVAAALVAAVTPGRAPGADHAIGPTP